MTNEQLINYKLELAQAFLENGHEHIARDIITKLINDGLGEDN